MLKLSGCKINLGLSVIGKRADGYHNIESVFYPVPWNDVIEIIPATHDELVNYGNPIPGSLSENLCLKAYKILSRDYVIPQFKWILLKNIPAGAGLGGGSANAATALQLINECCELNLTREQLLQYASQLGSDCPFFIENKPQFVSGRGEVLEPIDISLKGYQLIVIYPGIHINTATAFKKLAESKTYSNSGLVKEALQLPITEWKKNLKNDFEQVVFTEHQAIREIKDSLYHQGAVYASMSGSGSSVYGLFHSSCNLADLISSFKHFTVFSTNKLF